MALKQLRDSIKLKIKESPFVVTYSQTELIDDGYGGQIPNPFGTKTEYSDTVRISHEKIAVQGNEPSPVGLSTSFGLFLLGQYTCGILEDDIVTDQDNVSYKVGPIDSLILFNGVYGIQAPLVIVEVSEEST